MSENEWVKHRCIHLSDHLTEHLKPKPKLTRQPLMTDATAQSKNLPRLVYNLFSFWEGFTAHHKITAKKENVSFRGIAAQFIYNAICGKPGDYRGNSAEIVPLMKTNWRNQGSFLLPSQEANPNNMKLPKPRFSFAQKGLKSMERTMDANAKSGLTLTSTKRKGEYQHNNLLGWNQATIALLVDNPDSSECLE